MTTVRAPSMLVVGEDDSCLRKVMEETRRWEGCRVVAVSDGQGAWEARARAKLERIRRDTRLPRCDGLELLRRSRCDRDDRRRPSMILSAAAEMSDPRGGRSRGADDDVTKPDRAEDGLKTIEVRRARPASVKERLQSQQPILMRVLPRELRPPLAGISGHADWMVLLGESGTAWSARDGVDCGQTDGRAGRRWFGWAEDFSPGSWFEPAQGAPKPDGGGLKQQPLTAEAVRTGCQPGGAPGRRPAGRGIEGLPAGVRVPETGLERERADGLESALKFLLPGLREQVKTARCDGGGEIAVIVCGRARREVELGARGMMRPFGREK